MKTPKNTLTSVNLMTLHLVIYLLAHTKNPTQQLLCDICGLSRITIYRYIETLQERYGIDIVFHNISYGRHGRTGYYELRGWGIIDKEAFLLKMDETIDKLALANGLSSSASTT